MERAAQEEDEPCSHSAFLILQMMKDAVMAYSDDYPEADNQPH